MSKHIYDSQTKSRAFVDTFTGFWRYRELIVLLVKRDLSIRYKRSLFGIGWSLLNPLLTSLVLWVVFVQIFAQRFPDGASFAPYVLSGVLIVIFFQQGFNQAADAIAQGAAILMKVYVPPQIFAFAGAVSNAFNFSFGLIALAILSWITGDGVSIWFFMVIPMMVCMLMYITGLGLLISILYIRFQDTRNVVAVLLLLMTYLTPVFYPKEILSGPILWIATANPLTSYSDIFRHVFSNTGTATHGDWVFIITTSLVCLLVGIRTFVKAWPKTVVML
jgi:ABC-2 type transport system permease protein/lipopolysaccharide transport system permease protein